MVVVSWPGVAPAVNSLRIDCEVVRQRPDGNVLVKVPGCKKRHSARRTQKGYTFLSRFMPIAEAALALGTTVHSLRNWANARKLPDAAVRLTPGGHRLFDMAELSRWAQERALAATAHYDRRLD